MTQKNVDSASNGRYKYHLKIIVQFFPFEQVIRQLVAFQSLSHFKSKTTIFNEKKEEK